MTLIPVIGGSTLYPFVARRSEKISVYRVALGFALLGAAIALICIVVTPVLLPIVFGTRYKHAVPVTLVMLAALPLAFYSNGLMVAAYTEGRERALLRWTFAAALLGSAAVLAGQVAFGPTGAAAGFGLRLVLFSGGLVWLGRNQSSAPGRQSDNLDGGLSIHSPG
jgi:O-antigen/teichoic acid export membrane protein